MKRIKSNLLRNLLAEAIIGACLFSGCQQYNEHNPQMLRKTETLVAPKEFNLEQATEANKLLIDFPDKIPGAKSMEKYIVPGAEYCMVHMKQIHLGEKNSERGLRKIKEVQDNMHSILSYLVKNQEINKVYQESLTPSYQSTKNLFAKINYLSNNPEKSGEDVGIPSEIDSLGKLKRKNPELYKAYKQYQSEIEYDAVYRIASETQDFEILYADYHGPLMEADKINKETQGLGFLKYLTKPKKPIEIVFEKREDNFLNMVIHQESRLVVVVYGAGHAFGGKTSCGGTYDFKARTSICDNIAKNNHDHPDKKISLIEITPYGL